MGTDKSTEVRDCFSRWEGLEAVYLSKSSRELLWTCVYAVIPPGGTRSCRCVQKNACRRIPPFEFQNVGTLDEFLAMQLDLNSGGKEDDLVNMVIKQSNIDFAHKENTNTAN